MLFLSVFSRPTGPVLTGSGSSFLLLKSHSLRLNKYKGYLRIGYILRLQSRVGWFIATSLVDPDQTYLNRNYRLELYHKTETGILGNDVS